MDKGNIKLNQAAEFIDKVVKYPTNGLPEEIFLLISHLTPLVNVDLLIKDSTGRTLLSWRDDGYWPPGWHIPGGIIRFKERLSNRIHVVAKMELGVDVEYEKNPIIMNECIIKHQKDRGHFISFLYKCKLKGNLDKKMQYKKGQPAINQWKWHDKCPSNIIGVHEMYRKYIDAKK